MTKHRINILILIVTFLMTSMSFAQTFESLTFSSVASTNNNFQPIMGMPYCASLIGANGSLEISASYGESEYNESMLSLYKINHQSTIRIFPNPTSYFVTVDLSQIPRGDYTLSLIDVIGNIVSAHSSSLQTEQLNMSSFAIGTYILNIQNSKFQTIETFKIIKSK